MIRTVLQSDSRRLAFSFNSILDSGAEGCIFPSDIGEKVGIREADGLPGSSMGIGGSERLHYHKIKVWTGIEGQAWHFDCMAGFSSQLNRVGWGILGRTEFFSLFEEVTFDQTRKMLRLKISGQRPKKKKLGPLESFFGQTTHI